MTLTDITTSSPATSVWVRACALASLEPAWGEAILVGGRQIALVMVDQDEVYAVCHRDPVAGSPVMARGIVGSKGDRPTIASPLLKQVYDLGTGDCFTDPSLSITTFPTRIVDGFVEVAVPA